jgi:PAS domain S-box-containing protein
MIASLHTKKIATKNDRQLRVLFDNTNEHAICMLDNNGRIISWNMSAERMIGYTSEEVVGKNYSMFFSKEEIRRKISGKALAITLKKGRFMAEGIRVRKDGSHFWARSFLTLVEGGESGVTLFVLITQNIARERALEQKRDEYIGIASHELKNPITTLSLYSELLAKRLELDRDKKNLHMLHDIQSQAARLVTLVDDLLIVSKLEGGGTLELHKESFNPNAFVIKIIRDFQKSHPTHKIICKEKISYRVRADKDRIAQVVINLLTNAVKYSPRANKVLVRIGRGQNKCVISVQDFGAGIAKKDQRDVFTRFFRTDDAEVGNVAGSGLGLYISKEIIKKHHQRIWVESVVGKGTTFSFTLPLSK